MCLQHSLECICSACVVANNTCQQLDRGHRATGFVWLPVLLPLPPTSGCCTCFNTKDYTIKVTMVGWKVSMGMLCHCTNPILLVTFIWSLLSAVGCPGPLSSWAWSLLISTGSCYMLQGWSMGWRKRLALALINTETQKKVLQKEYTRPVYMFQDITLHLTESPKQIFPSQDPFLLWI